MPSCVTRGPRFGFVAFRISVGGGAVVGWFLFVFPVGVVGGLWLCGGLFVGLAVVVLVGIGSFGLSGCLGGSGVGLRRRGLVSVEFRDCVWVAVEGLWGWWLFSLFGAVSAGVGVSWVGWASVVGGRWPERVLSCRVLVYSPLVVVYFVVAAAA